MSKCQGISDSDTYLRWIQGVRHECPGNIGFINSKQTAVHCLNANKIFETL